MSLVYSINNKRICYNDLFKNEIKGTDPIPNDKIVARFDNKNFIINCDEDGYGYPKEYIGFISSIHPNINFHKLFEIYSDKIVMPDTLSIVIKLKLMQIPLSETKKTAIFSFDSGLSKKGKSNTFIVATDSSGIIYTTSGGRDNYYNFYDHLDFNKEYCLIFFINKKNTGFYIQKLYVNGEKVGRGVPNISDLVFPTYNILKSFSIGGNTEDYIKYKSIDIYDHELTPVEILYHSKCIGHYRTDINNLINNTLYDLSGNENHIICPDNNPSIIANGKKYFLLMNPENYKYPKAIKESAVGCSCFLINNNDTTVASSNKNLRKYRINEQRWSDWNFSDNRSIFYYLDYCGNEELDKECIYYISTDWTPRINNFRAIDKYLVFQGEDCEHPINEIRYWNTPLTDEELSIIRQEKMYITKSNNTLCQEFIEDENNIELDLFSNFKIENIEESNETLNMNLLKDRLKTTEIIEL